MRTLHIPIALAALLSVLSAGVAAWPAESRFVAFSLRAAGEAIRSAGAIPEPVQRLGGITQVLGLVHDAETGDIILVGRTGTGDPAPTLDDLVVALRARFLHDQWPLVSIEPTERTRESRRQAVRFAGGVEARRFGALLFAADLLLKRLALGLADHGLEGLESYYELCVSALRRDPASVDRDVGARFWFVVPEDRPLPTLSVEAGAYVALDLPLAVRSEVFAGPRGATAGGTASDKRAKDSEADRFALAMTRRFPELGRRFPELDRLRTLFDMSALADAMKSLVPPGALDYWLRECPVATVPTPVDHELLVREDAGVRLGVHGGMELRVILAKLSNGEASGFRDAVLKSRPGGAVLLWEVPLAGWACPRGAGSEPGAAPIDGGSPPLPRKEIGAFIQHFHLDAAKGALPAGPVGLPPSLPSFTVPPPPVPHANLQWRPTLPWQGAGRQIGGVFLADTARVEGLDASEVGSVGINPATGSFSLIVNGEGVDLEGTNLRKFVTVLWAVYFSPVPPGISIDPISPESDKQLVRFIGNIRGTALAKVLLIADYYMKKCAIGLVLPPVPGFRPVDQLVSELGMSHFGVGRRFWFVPKDMTFRRSGNALVFDGGRMTLLTEKMLQGERGVSDPADQAFAAFWTRNYWEIAAVNPVFDAMYEYARLTALATYLKENGVSLLWFLLANRHLILREEVEGTVDTLRADSRFLAGVSWSGGVNLAVGMSPSEEGRYYVDRTTEESIRQAWARQAAPAAKAASGPGAPRPPSTLGDSRFQVKLGRASYTVLPARSLCGGAAVKGKAAFHTDVALRVNGQPGLEVVRWNAAGRPPGEFGEGWRLFLPCSIRPAGAEQVKACDVPVPGPEGSQRKVEVLVPRTLEVTDVLDGRKETLVFASAKPEGPGWAPERSEESRYAKAALLADGGLLLEEKSGCAFRFDGRLQLREMAFSPTHAMRLDYEGGRVVSVADSFGGRAAVAYDGPGRVESLTSPVGTVRYRYLDGELATLVQPAGERLVMIYRKDGSLEEVVIRGAPARVPGPSGSLEGD
ncbi:MAG: hypothetical protein HY721_09525 [Planctomycetes bacterium]|nr:hypothetical protein [Planctomycetota bacterium]